MRRILSITAILALLSTILSPMAAACTGTAQAVSCHSMEATHCDRTMHGHHHHAAEASPATPSVTAGRSDEKCPMDCCTPGHRQSGSVTYSTSLLPPIAVSEPNVHIVPVHFISAGFSSHTDRGPPNA
ncbi:MAG TPA: hypothetical protein VIB39_19565 [Candidatus Angelobacter sp.]